METYTQKHLRRSIASCRMVKTVEEGVNLFQTLGKSAAIDFETTALYPMSDLHTAQEPGARVRLTSVCNDKVHFLIDHDLLGPLSQFTPYMVGITWWAFYSKFEIKWIDAYAQHDKINVRDVQFLRTAKLGGGPNKLAWMAKEIGIDLSKDEQASDWSRLRLTEAQINYAGFDSYVTWLLVKHWLEETTSEQQEAAEFIFDASVRATLECEDRGLRLDSPYYSGVVKLWHTKQALMERTLRRFTPPSIISNLRSDAQVGKFLKAELPPSLLESWPKTEKKEQLQLESKYLLSVARRVNYPFSRWLVALARFKYYNKYLSTYGDTLLTKQALSGKIYSSFNIAAARTGRFSSSNSNLQNIPRRPLVRRAFVSPSLGRRLVLADYSGIEIRVLAELSGDKQLLEDAIYGDVHAASAAQLFGHDYDYVREVLASEGKGRYANIYYVIKEQRSKAKGFTFQLLYGAGAAALSDVLRCSFEEAENAIRLWAARYPKAYGYRQRMFDCMNADGFLPVVSGRTIYVKRPDRSMPVAANYPIQGAAADVIYRAMYRTRQRFIEHDLDAYLCASVHDELLSDAHKDDAEKAMTQQLLAMRDAWLDIFPGSSTDNLTDHAIGMSWADKP